MFGEMVTMSVLYDRFARLKGVGQPPRLTRPPTRQLLHDVPVLWARLKRRLERDLAFNAKGCRFPEAEV